MSVPGPQGEAGADGADGTSGSNAFTDVAAQFVQPAVNDSVSVEVGNSAWASVGQIVFVEGGGDYLVLSKPDATHLVLENLGHDSNSPPGTVIPAGAHVSPSGEKGASGAAAGGVLLSVNNLNDVASIATSRSNLGLGALALLNTNATAQYDNLSVTAAKLAAVLDLTGKTVTLPLLSVEYVNLSQSILGILPRAFAYVDGQGADGECHVEANFGLAVSPGPPFAVTRNGAGVYDVLFFVPLATADYLVVFGVESAAGAQNFILSYTTKTVSGFTVLCATTSAAAPTLGDPDQFSFIVIGGYV